MTDIVIILLFALGLKHIICNFILRPFIIALECKLHQNGYPSTGLIYLLTHIITTLVVFLSFVSFTPTLLLIAVISALVHYIIDQSNKSKDDVEIDYLVQTNTRWLNGFDQWVHVFVYLTMTTLLVSLDIIR